MHPHTAPSLSSTRNFPGGLCEPRCSPPPRMPTPPLQISDPAHRSCLAAPSSSSTNAQPPAPSGLCCYSRDLSLLQLPRKPRIDPPMPITAFPGRDGAVAAELGLDLLSAAWLGTSHPKTIRDGAPSPFPHQDFSQGNLVLPQLNSPSMQGVTSPALPLRNIHGKAKIPV